MQTDIIDAARAKRAKTPTRPKASSLPTALRGKTPIGTVQVPLKFSDAYAMKVKGDCLSPRILNDDTIVVSPSAGIGAGIIVAIAFKDGSEGKVKYLDHVPRQPRPGDEVIEMWRFLQINPRQVYFADPEKVECVHAVVGVVRDGKFAAIETLVAS